MNKLYTLTGCLILLAVSSISFGQIGNNTISSPVTGTACQTPAENGTATFTAPSGMTFTSVDFASYGTPTGSCGSFSVNASCNASTSKAVVEGYLLGKSGTISIGANNATFGDPCVGTTKKLYIQASYNDPICYGTSPGQITGSSPTGSIAYSYVWQKSTTGPFSGFTVISGATEKSYTPGSLTQTTWFRRIVSALWLSDNYSAAIQIYVQPPITVSGTSTFTCVGGSTGTVTVSASSGTSPFTYSIDGGSYQAGNTFSGLAAGSHTITAKSSDGCVGSSTVNVSSYPNSSDDQNSAGTNTWIGHAYQGTAFNNYVGYFAETETFNEGFGGNQVCFPITSTSGASSLYTEQFSVAFKMKSTKRGLYVVDLGSDDGSRLTVDGTLIYNNWVDQSFISRPRVLMNLTGNSLLNYEFYENSTNNQSVFQNLTLVLANNLSTNTSQNVCLGSNGAVISGDVFGILPAGLSTAAYQWSYSKTVTGARTDIAGATASTFTPNTSVAPFNVAGTYYVYRNAKVSSSNNTGFASYTATNESNAAVITVNTSPAAPTVTTPVSYCQNATAIPLSATGSSLNWGQISGTAGGTGNLTTNTYVESLYSNKKTNFTTTTPNVKINTVDYTLPAWQTVSGLTLALYNSSGTVIAISSTITSQGASGSPVSITNTFNYTLTSAGNYSVGIYAGTGTIGADSAVFPITESTGTINVTGVVMNGTGPFHCFNNIQFTVVNGSVPPTPSTLTSGSTNYSVTQTVNGCTSSAATITVNVNTSNAATILYSGTPFCNSLATAVSVTRTGTSGGTYTASPTGLTINSTTGAITASTSIPGTYTVSYTMAANGACAAQTAITSVTVTALTAATISYAAASFCNSVTTAQSVTQTGTTGGTYTASPTGLTINSTTGAITPSTSTAGTYTVSYTMAASGGCIAQTATTFVTINSMLSATISYAGTPYCSSAGMATVTLTGTTGGTFTSDANLVIDAATGNINLANSTAGSHTITYTVSAVGGCSAFSTTAAISITTQPYAAGFYPNSPYCSNIGTLIPTGSQKGLMGTLSATPSGLSINPSTGVINVSTSTTGSYTVYYNVPAYGGCSAYAASAPIVISTAPSATIKYAAASYCYGAGTASITRTGTEGGVYSSTAGLVIDAVTGDINLNTSTPGTYTVSYKIAAANGCSEYTKTCTVIINAKVSALTFADGSSSTRCQGAGSVTYPASATNSTGIVYSLDATSLAAGNAINSSTGVVTYVSNWSGTSVITAFAAGCSPLSVTHTITTSATPTVTATTTLACVGGNTGTITASGSGGLAPYTYSLNGGTYQSASSFNSLAIATYTLTIKSAAGCTSSTSVTVNTYPVSTDDQNTSGTSNWIGHIYNGKSFQNYVGYFSEAETFNENFIGDATCFPVSSSSGISSIYTDQFSVRFKMNSTKKGLYLVNLGSDDGSRLYVDNTLIANDWADHAFVSHPNVLINLTGSSSLKYEFYENAGGNQVAFQNLTLVLANSLTSNTSQAICFGNSGSAISGDTYGTIPSGISLSGTGYQWSYSVTATGARTDIAGATDAVFTPNSSTAPFNVPGTYYVYRNAKISSSNNAGFASYTATNESNAAVIVVTAVPSATISYVNTPLCNTSAAPESVTFTGTQGGVFSSPGLLINPSTGSIVPNQNAVGNYTIIYSIPATGGCSSLIASTTVSIGRPGTWSGKVDTSWNNAANWICGVIPNYSTDADIPKVASVFPTVISGTAQAKNVNIQSGASVVVIGTIKISGDINNSGILNVSNGTIEMNGSNLQTISGGMFENKTIKNLVVNNTGSGLSVSSTANDTLKITGLLSFGNASAILNTGDNITLVSNNAGTASVGIVGDGNAINGKVVVERFVNTGTGAGQHPKSWQFLAVPTSGQTIKQSWMENGQPVSYYGAMISGPGGATAGFDTSSAAAAMKYFDDVTGNWIGVSNANNPIADLRGYMVFVRGDRTVTGAAQAANATVLRTKGTLYTKALAPISVRPDQFQSLGNPYAAPIDFTLISKSAAIDNKFYVYDPYLYGSYGVGGYQTLTAVNNWQPVPGGTTAYPSNVANSTIQSGQAFFVHSTAANSTGTSIVNFMENAKSLTTGSTKFSRMDGEVTNPKRQFLRASLITSAGVMADGNVIAFDKNFSDAVDANDAVKFLNSGENFSVKTGGKLLAVEAMSPVSADDTIYYYTSNLSKISYKLVFAPENMQNAGVEAFLVDKFLNTETPVSLFDTTFIGVTVNPNTASFATDRFRIIFRQPASLPVTITSVTATLKNQDVEVKWNVQNESGIQQYQIEKSSDGVHFNQTSPVKAKNSVTGNYSWIDPNVGEGTYYYCIKIISVDGKTTYTQIVKVVAGKIQQQMSVYPNPVVDGIVHLQFENQPEGVYVLRLFNQGGQVIISKKITHAKGTSEEKLACQNLSKGIYDLEITKTDGSKEVIKVLF